jgi:hypothetical protein
MSKTNNRKLRERVRRLEAMVQEREASNAWKSYTAVLAKLNDLGEWGEEMARTVYRLKPGQTLTRTSFDDLTRETTAIVAKLEAQERTIADLKTKLSRSWEHEVDL